jgi:hypothetical protein
MSDSAVLRGQFAAVFLMTALAQGCAVLDPKPDAEVVKEKAQARWSSVIKGDLEKSYGFLSPASRGSVTFEQYSERTKKGFWKAVTLDKVDCPSPTVCEVYAKVDYETRGARMSTPWKESWIKEGSAWWYVQR